MAKDTYYFSHDFHSRNDRKMKRLLLKEKVSGIGIYWCLVEMLHEEGGYISLSEIEVIAQELHVSTEKLTKIIKNYELFKFNEDKFWSSSALCRIDKKKEKSKKAKESISYRWGNDTNVLETNNDGSTNENRTNNDSNTIKGKESKGNKEEKKDSDGGFAPPPPPSDVSGFNYLPDGRSYIDRTVFFTQEDFDGIPDDKNEAIRETLLVVKKIETTELEIATLWKSFKVMNLTFQKPYRNKDDVYNHFSNWCKTQSFSRKSEPRQKKVTPVGKIVGSEFINDFTQCRMSDGSILELTPNQRDSAKYQGIKPSSIVKS